MVGWYMYNICVICLCVSVRGAKTVATAVVFNRGAKRRRFSVEPPERLYVYM